MAMIIGSVCHTSCLLCRYTRRDVRQLRRNNASPFQSESFKVDFTDIDSMPVKIKSHGNHFQCLCSSTNNLNVESRARAAGKGCISDFFSDFLDQTVLVPVSW